MKVGFSTRRIRLAALYLIAFPLAVTVLGIGANLWFGNSPLHGFESIWWVLIVAMLGGAIGALFKPNLVKDEA